MDKIGFVLLEKTDHPDVIYRSADFAAGKSCSKILAFTANKKKAVLQVWIDENEIYKQDIYTRPQEAPGIFRKSNYKTFIQGIRRDLHNRIPAKFKMNTIKPKGGRNINI